MKYNTKIVIVIVCMLATITTANDLKPQVSFAFEGGATMSYLKSDSLMEKFFAPTATGSHSLLPTFTFSVNGSVGRYFGFATGLGYTYYGQSTSLTKVYFRDDIYEHDFESSMKLSFVTVPLIVKAGIKKTCYSLFLRGGIVPSLLINNELVWKIDGRVNKPGSSRVPPVKLKPADAPLHFGGEAGYHLGKNSLFIIAQYNYGFRNIAWGVSGNVYLRSYGITLQYRRDL